MISPEAFFAVLRDEGVGFVTGVPDSLLAGVCSYFATSLPKRRHVIAPNEGGAVAVAAGFHLATGGIPLIYLQNSGVGNSVNPLTSLVDPEVYAIPVVLLVGWRGEPDTIDEPQHRKQGRITPGLLTCLEIPYRVLERDLPEASASARWAVTEARRRSGPTALLVRRGTFSASLDRVSSLEAPALPPRELAIECLVEAACSDSVIVATTGMIGRELCEYRRRTGKQHGSDFLTVGSMGHASQIALGLCLARPELNVVCLDGDGAALMHLGGVALIGAQAPERYLHVILNNGAHDSVGGQPTVGFEVDFVAIARACGYAETSTTVSDVRAIPQAVRLFQATPGPTMLEVRVARGSRPDLMRPRETPVENKHVFVSRLRGAET